MNSGAYREMIPTEIVLPCEHTDATITVPIVVMGGLVRAPGLPQLQAALARGSVELVKHYCEMWTRWLNRVDRPAKAAS